MCAQRGLRFVGEVHRAPARLGFGRTEEEIASVAPRPILRRSAAAYRLQLLLDRERALVEVDVPPLQTQQLTLTQATLGQQHEGRLYRDDRQRAPGEVALPQPVVPRRGVEESLVLRVGEDAGIDDGPCGVARWTILVRSAQQVHQRPHEWSEAGVTRAGPSQIDLIDARPSSDARAGSRRLGLTAAVIDAIVRLPAQDMNADQLTLSDRAMAAVTWPRSIELHLVHDQSVRHVVKAVIWLGWQGAESVRRPRDRSTGGVST